MKRIVLGLLMGMMGAFVGSANLYADAPGSLDFNDQTAVGTPAGLSFNAQNQLVYRFGDDSVTQSGALNLSFRDSEGNMLLHLALLLGGDAIDRYFDEIARQHNYGTKNLAQFLVQKAGMDPFVKNKSGQNALDLVISQLKSGSYREDEYPICTLKSVLVVLGKQLKKPEALQALLPYIITTRAYAENIGGEHNRESLQVLTKLQSEVERALGFTEQVGEKSSSDMVFTFEDEKK